MRAVRVAGGDTNHYTIVRSPTTSSSLLFFVHQPQSNGFVILAVFIFRAVPSKVFSGAAAQSYWISAWCSKWWVVVVQWSSATGHRRRRLFGPGSAWVRLLFFEWIMRGSLRPRWVVVVSGQLMVSPQSRRPTKHTLGWCGLAIQTQP